MKLAARWSSSRMNKELSQQKGTITLNTITIESIKSWIRLYQNSAERISLMKIQLLQLQLDMLSSWNFYHIKYSYFLYWKFVHKSCFDSLVDSVFSIFFEVLWHSYIIESGLRRRMLFIKILSKKPYRVPCFLDIFDVKNFGLRPQF